jgi:hypothetical protein
MLSRRAWSPLSSRRYWPSGYWPSGYWPSGHWPGVVAANAAAAVAVAVAVAVSGGGGGREVVGAARREGVRSRGSYSR